jgi:hypothetical protein
MGLREGFWEQSKHKNKNEVIHPDFKTRRMLDFPKLHDKFEDEKTEFYSKVDLDDFTDEKKSKGLHQFILTDQHKVFG